MPTGHRGVITVGGAIKGIEQEGYAWIWPWQKMNVFNIRAEQADIKDAEGATFDTQPVVTSLVVRYSVLPDKVVHVFEQYSKDGNLDSYIMTAAMETFKAVTAKYTATELIAKRDKVSIDVTTALRSNVSIYGAQIIKIDMTSFNFSKQYMDAINQKTTQEQLRMAAENKVLTVEAQQKEKVAVAEAEARALRAQADGQAYAVTKKAEAEANSLRIQNSALRESKEVLELRRIEVDMVKAGKWNGALPQNMYAGAPIPFMNIPSTNQK